MRRRAVLAAALAASVALEAGCKPRPSRPDQLPHCAKGYELYSFPVEGEWRYTLITGTDREKTFVELSSPDEGAAKKDGWVKVSAAGWADAARLIARLPRGEQVVWQAKRPEGLSLAPAYEQARLIEAARDAGVDLRVAP